MSQSRVEKMHENKNLSLILLKVPLLDSYNQSNSLYGWYPFRLVFKDCVVIGK